MEANSIAVAVGERHTCALSRKQGLWCWGSNHWGQTGHMAARYLRVPQQVDALRSRTKSVAAGYQHTCTATTVGEVLCWGRNNAGQVGVAGTLPKKAPVSVGQKVHGAVAVTAGNEHSCSLTKAGKVWCWGRGRLGLLHGKPRANDLGPSAVDIPAESIVAVSAGDWHTCALSSSSEVWCWGGNFADGEGDPATVRRVE